LKLDPIGWPMSAPIQSGSDLTGENVEKCPVGDVAVMLKKKEAANSGDLASRGAKLKQHKPSLRELSHDVQRPLKGASLHIA
jgi:hypothetical protein